MQKIILLVSTLLFSTFSHAEKHALIMGGGGEPAGATTIFDSSIGNTSDYFRVGNYKNIDVSFDGGHATTEFLVKFSYSKANSVSNFTGKNYSKMVDKYITKIRSGEIKSGDQLLVMINTHGAEQVGSELTHKIATSDNGGEVSLDLLKTLQVEAEKKGVKLAIIDNSCYSGGSISLGSDKTCVISASGPHHHSFSGQGTFGELFERGMKPGVNLEKIFLNARALSTNGPDFPMISTDIGKSINKAIYKNITPYLLYDRDDLKPLSKYVSTMSKDNTCSKKDGLQELEEIIKQVEKSDLMEIEIEDDLYALKAALKVYNKTQDEMIKLNKEIPDRVVYELSTVPPTPIKISDLNLYLTQLGSMIADAKKTSNPDIQNVQKLYDVLKKLKDDHAKELAQTKRITEKLDSLAKDSYSQAVKISSKERALYDIFYKEKMKTNKAPNPCKDFVL